LCNFAVKGSACDVNEDIARLVRGMHESKRPMGFFCIAPAVAAKVLGSAGIKLTIGNEKETADALEQCGVRHVDCPPGEICVDEEHLIVSTPAYMYDSRPSVVADGIDKAVKKVIELARK